MDRPPTEAADGDLGEPRAARVVAVGNLKGGTGKSTIAVNLACLAAQVHGRAILVDADPQGTAAAWLEEAGSDGRPAGLGVEAWPLAEAADSRTADLWAERIYRLAEPGVRVVVDLPPQLGRGFDAMLHMADALLVPVTPSAIDLRAIARTLKRLKQVQQQRGNRPTCLLVPNRVDQRTAVGRTIQRALRDLEIAVAPPLAQRASHATAFAARQWIGDHAPGSPAFREMAAVAATLEKLLRTCPANDYAGAPLALEPAAVASPAAQKPSPQTPPAARQQRERSGFLASLLNGFGLLGRPQSG